MQEDRFQKDIFISRLDGFSRQNNRFFVIGW